MRRRSGSGRSRRLQFQPTLLPPEQFQLRLRHFPLRFAAGFNGQRGRSAGHDLHGTRRGEPQLGFCGCRGAANRDRGGTHLCHRRREHLAGACHSRHGVSGFHRVPIRGQQRGQSSAGAAGHRGERTCSGERPGGTNGESQRDRRAGDAVVFSEQHEYSSRKHNAQLHVDSDGAAGHPDRRGPSDRAGECGRQCGDRAAVHQSHCSFRFRPDQPGVGRFDPRRKCPDHFQFELQCAICGTGGNNTSGGRGRREFFSGLTER